jgi:hypothetical protein
MQINLIPDSSVSAAPAAFWTAVNAAASFLDGLIVNPITVNIQVGYGEDDNGAYSIGDNLSIGGAFFQSTVGYSTLKSDLAANATNALDQLAVASLPTSDPTGGEPFFVGDAEARALGLLPASSTIMDGAVGFNDSYSWNYSTDGQAVPGEFDFFSVAEVELMHSLGMQLGTTSGSTAFMLFRYSAPGVRELTINGDEYTTPAAYFSIDGGQTNLGNYLTSGDSTLFDAESPIDVNDTLAIPYLPGVDHTFSPTDALELNVLGFEVNLSVVSAITAGQAAIWDLTGTNVSGGGTVSPNPGPSWKAIGTGDFNDDNHSDILWRNTDGQAAIWDMNGSTLIGGGAVNPNPGPSWKAIGTGDFNHDGHSDILWQNTNGQAAVWDMNGNTLIGGGAVNPNPGPSWNAIGTGDFNDDGHSDILWQNSNGQAAIWDMNGSTLIGGGAVNPNPGPSWKAIGTGDFNHDAHSDILWQNTDGEVAIWEMNGNNLIGGGAVSADPGPAWRVVGTGGEGSSDILLQSTSGQTALWNMSGTNIIGGGVVSLNAGPSWKAIGTADGSDILFQNTGGQTPV